MSLSPCPLWIVTCSVLLLLIKHWGSTLDAWCTVPSWSRSLYSSRVDQLLLCDCATEKAALTATEPEENCHALMVLHDSNYSEPRAAEDNGSFIPSRETAVMSWNNEGFR